MRFKILDKEMIMSRFCETETGLSLVYRKETDSTNDMALRERSIYKEGNVVFVAENQTKGKGRRGRSWDVSDNCCLTFSILLKPDIPVTSFSMLTLVMGMAVADGIEKVSGIKTGIKWPNDIVFDGKKVCGILTETSPDLKYVVIGAGVNTGECEWPDELKYKAISLEECGWKDPSCEELLCSITECFFENYDIFKKTNDMSLLKEEYNNRLVHKNKEVVISGKTQIKALSHGINNMGELMIIDNSTGKQINIIGGEVSVHGVYKE